MTDIFEVIKEQARDILRKEGLDTPVSIKRGVWRTKGDHKAVQFGELAIKGVLSWGKEARRYYVYKEEENLIYHYKPEHKLAPHVKLISVILEEVAHAISTYKYGSIGYGHGAHFKHTFVELWKKYFDDLSSALSYKANTYIPKVFEEVFGEE